ncbi:unnamed protein product [Coregonus sp. 'balchen']|nr:unnamed protein product [Coregonus sp. 'balchen']
MKRGSRWVLPLMSRWTSHLTNYSWSAMYCYRSNPECRYLASSSKDGAVRVWDVVLGRCERILTGHTQSVTCVNTDYVLRTGAFDPADATINPQDQTGTSEDKKPLARLTGHSALVNEVLFSPDTRLLASASFDKSIKIWDGRTGKYLQSLRGHVAAVYQVAWSADSRLMVSGSSDSTLKVFAVDWSPDGQRVVSGGKDKCLRIRVFPNTLAALHVVLSITVTIGCISRRRSSPRKCTPWGQTGVKLTSTLRQVLSYDWCRTRDGDWSRDRK